MSEVIYAVNNAITGRTVEVRWDGSTWRAICKCATFQFFSFESAKRGARIISEVTL